MNHLPIPATPLAADALATLLDRAEQCVAAQREAYGTESDEDRAWRAAWNTWQTLKALIPAVRTLLDQPEPPTPATAARHLRSVGEAA